MVSILNLFVFIGVILLLPTAYAAKIGAPYAPTFTAAIRKALVYIKLGKGDFLVDLGAGDGRVLLEANRLGANALGYELSPFLVPIIWLRSLGKRGIRIKMANFYKQKLPAETTVVFAFLMPEHMDQVKDFLAKQHLPKARFMLVYSFPFKNVEPVQVIQTPKCGRMYIYDLPVLVNHK